MIKWVLTIAMSLLIICNSIAQNNDKQPILQYLESGEQAQNPEEKRDLFLKAYALATNLNEDDLTLIALQNLATLEISQQEIASALRYLLESIPLYEQKNDFTNIKKANFEIGTLYQREELYSEAINYYQKTRSFLEGKPNQTAELDNIIGTNFSNLLMPDSAKYYFDKAAVLNSDDPSQKLQALRKIERAYHKASNFETALEYDLKIYENVKNSNDKKVIGNSINNIGVGYSKLNNNIESISWLEKSEEYYSENNSLRILYTNLAIAHYNIKNRDEARSYLFKALSLTDANQKEEQANLNNVLSNMYLDINDFHNAQIYNDKAISQTENFENDELKARIYESSADIYTGLFEYEEAIQAYQNQMKYRDKIAQQSQREEEKRLQEKVDLEKAEKDVRLLSIQGEIQQLEIDQLKLKQQKDSVDLTNLNLENIKSENEIQLLKRAEQLQAASIQNQELENERQRLELIKSRQEFEAIQREIKLSELARVESEQKSELERQDLALKAEADRNELLKTEAENITLELDNEKIRTKFARGIGILLFLISTMVLGGLFYTRKTNQKLNQQNIEIEKNKNEIEKERKKSDQLLLNILPISVAEELKSTGKATPRLHKNVTVLFTDFVNFTKISSNLLPEDILDELNECFTAFDEICSKYKLEKIKTIGDGYLAVSGLPMALDEAALAAANSSIEMMAFMNRRSESLSQKGKDYWDLRIGLHSGDVVAGVLGTSKFVYDIWGDTVNTASRMESNSVPGKINVSESTYLQLKDQFNFEYRGEIRAKNKGPMKMYFLN